MTLYYKATRPDGTDFRTGSVDYAAALRDGTAIGHPYADLDHPCHAELLTPNVPSTYLSVSTEKAETLIGGDWPCRLFQVEPSGPLLDNLDAGRFKRGCGAIVRVVAELPAWEALGPYGAAVAAVIERARRLTAAEFTQLGAARDAAWGAAWGAARDAAWSAARDAAWGAAWDAAWGAARDAAWGAARDAAWGAARDAAWGAAVGELARDLINDEQYQLLAGPWLSVIGTPLLAAPPIGVET